MNVICPTIASLSSLPSSPSSMSNVLLSSSGCVSRAKQMAAPFDGSSRLRNTTTLRQILHTPCQEDTKNQRKRRITLQAQGNQRGSRDDHFSCATHRAHCSVLTYPNESTSGAGEFRFTGKRRHKRTQSCSSNMLRLGENKRGTLNRRD